MSRVGERAGFICRNIVNAHYMLVPLYFPVIFAVSLSHVISSAQWTVGGSSELKQLRASVPLPWCSCPGMATLEATC